MAVVKATELIALLSNSRKAPGAILIHGADRSAVYELCQRVVKKFTNSGDETLNLSRLTEFRSSVLQDGFMRSFRRSPCLVEIAWFGYPAQEMP